MIVSWLSMWTHPWAHFRETVRTKPKSGFLSLATLYAVATLFSLANFYSWGLYSSFSSFFALLLAGSPIIGAALLYVDSWILQWTGLLFQGKAPIWHIRAALAWSKIPCISSLFMWFTLLATNNSDTAFIQAFPGPSGLFITLISLILALWSLILLAQGIREVQAFSFSRSMANVFISEILSLLLILIIGYIIRYVFISF